MPDVFFASSVHRGAWGFLRESLKSGEPFIMVSGAFGTGKTLLCLKLLRSIAARGLGPCVYLSTPAQGYGDMLRRAHEAVGLPTPAADADIGALTEGLYAHFRAGREARRRLFLLIEDPQDCDAATLHRLRLLPNFNIDGWYPVCVLFFAHTSFPALLREARWAPLDQRIKLRYRLTGLEPGETREYIYYRLLKARGRAGGPAPVFSEDAIARLHGLARGIPRAINALAGTCLSLAGARNQTRIDAAIVAAAAKWLGGDDADSETRKPVAVETDTPAISAPAPYPSPTPPVSTNQPGYGTVFAKSREPYSGAHQGQPAAGIGFAGQQSGFHGGGADAGMDGGRALGGSTPEDSKQTGNLLWWSVVALFALLIVLVAVARFTGI